MSDIETCWWCEKPATLTSGISFACDSCAKAQGLQVEAGFSRDEADALVTATLKSVGDDERTGYSLSVFASEVERVMNCSEVLSTQYSDRDCLEYLQQVINGLLDERRW